MKYLICFVLFAFSMSSAAKSITIKISDDDNSSASWHCKIKVFTDEFEAFGDSKTEATYRTQKKCQAKNHEMHCKDVTCEGDGEAHASNEGWICKLNPFTKSYEVFHESKTIAKAKVMKKCKQDNNEMHCDEPDCTQQE